MGSSQKVQSLEGELAMENRMSCVCKQDKNENISEPCMTHGCYADSHTAKELYKLAGLVMAKSVGLTPTRRAGFQEAAEMLMGRGRELRKLAGFEEKDPVRAKT